MKFLLLSQYFYPEIGATQVRLGAICKELFKQGHQVEVITALPNYPTNRIFPEYKGRLFVKEKWEGINIYRFWVYPATGSGLKRSINYGSFFLSSIFGVFFIRQKPDYIFVDSPPPFLSITAKLYSLFNRVPIIFNVADLWPDTVKQMNVINSGLILKAAYRLERSTYKWAKYINAVTLGNIKTFIEKKGIPRYKILFLPNGVDINLFRPLEPNIELAKKLNVLNKKVILFAGGLGYAQGLDVVVNAMSVLKNELADLVFVFMGNGPEKERVGSLVEKLKLKNIILVDAKPLNLVPQYYSISYAGFASLKNLPLFEEVRPSKIFPIMACGRPIIYSGAGETAKLIRNADCGLVVPPEDHKALANAISVLVKDGALAKKYGQNGRKYAEKNYDWAMLVKNWITDLKDREQKPL
jgi:colanic acid biosynthesis glycosyl transferase WcaI